MSFLPILLYFMKLFVPSRPASFDAHRRIPINSLTNAASPGHTERERKPCSDKLNQHTGGMNMKRILFAVSAVLALMLVMTGCRRNTSTDINNTTTDTSVATPETGTVNNGDTSDYVADENGAVQDQEDTSTVTDRTTTDNTTTTTTTDKATNTTTDNTNTDVATGTSRAGSAVDDAANGVRNAVRDAGDAVADVADGAANAVDDVVNGTDRTVDDVMRVPNYHAAA